MVGQIDENPNCWWIDGWMDGWMDGWTASLDGWTASLLTKQLLLRPSGPSHVRVKAQFPW